MSHTLDLYAGSGALGIEALSRGAEDVDFVERNHRCCYIIKENLKHTGLSERSRVFRMDAKKAIRTLDKQYTLIFLDPPYFDHSAHTMLEEVADSSLTGRQTTIVMEHSQKMIPEETCGKFHMIRRLRHGDTCVSIYQFAGGED